MGEVHYMISEAAKRVNVETHALRYWEEELNLSIGRTEMGHRYYTEEDIQLFCCIKELKEQGMLLKDLKELIPDLLKLKAKKTSEKNTELTTPEPQIMIHEEENENLLQVQNMMAKIFQNVVTENNKLLEKNITISVHDHIMKDMAYLLQAKEREEEERFKKLDSLIRQQQSLRKEAANAPGKKWKRILGTGISDL